jgi:hypothetical protein
MSEQITRRGMLLGAAAVAGGVAFGDVTPPARAAGHGVLHQHGRLPAEAMQRILQAEGEVSDGVLSVDISRDDIGSVRGPRGVTFTSSFEIDGTLTFQPMGDKLAFFNGDLALTPSETQPFIDAIIAHGLTFQAFHQHYVEMNPAVWFIHWRGMAEPLALARAVRATLGATGTRFPQTMPKHPRTPLDAKRLAGILHGDAQVGEDGVVTVDVDRSDRIVIGRDRANPDLNIMTEIQFKPHGPRGAADVAPDFSLIAREVQPVVALMRSRDWFVGCLYNQETAERPQLYFSHMLKHGDAYALAAEIRQALDRTASQ